ncbi:MAG: hypothetical protein AMXMBFR34_43410 [Myxococcaceae bacterium]
MSETGPSERVLAFIQAMNRWELDSWAAYRQVRSTPDPTAFSDQSARALGEIVREFCVAAQAEIHGATPFGRPPHHDPSTEQVVSERREPGGDALVETLRTGAVLGAGRYRYRLRKENGRWRILALEKEEQQNWLQVPLPMLDQTRVPRTRH